MNCLWSWHQHQSDKNDKQKRASWPLAQCITLNCAYQCLAGSRGVKILADQLIKDAAGQKYDLIACPGGMPGAERLRDSAVLNDLISQQQAAGRFYAAICATPAVFFETKGILQGARATAHPAFSNKLSNQAAVSERVVVDGKLTTSRGPGTAFEFALSLVKQLYGEFGTLLCK
eukprot:GHUV01046555.1.p1 GENE.GHUV01046555.1~~GHUV01046555.1.p1  ORF type:complete len:174 (-),score=44.88 GHUV01046555.1:180-701(-)